MEFPISRYSLNLSSKIITNIYNAIDEDNIDEFYSLYNYYSTNKDIYNSFCFQNIDSIKINYYSLCSCKNKNLIKIDNNRYQALCNCENGKRYLALLECYKNICSLDYPYLTTIKDVMRTKQYSYKFRKTKCIKYLLENGEIDVEYRDKISNDKNLK